MDKMSIFKLQVGKVFFEQTIGGESIISHSIYVLYSNSLHLISCV